MLNKIDKTIPLLALILILTVFLFVLLWLTFTTAHEHDLNKTELIVLSNNVLHDNNTLIRLIRNYVVTGDLSYRDAYITLLNDPDSFNNSLERMLEIGLTDTEIEKVNQIIDTWSILEEIENKVLRDMESGNVDNAIAIVFGDEYLQADYILADTIQKLINNIEDRSALATSQFNIRTAVVMIVFSGAYLVLVIILALIYRNNQNLKDYYKKQKDDFELEATTLQYIFDSLPIAVRIASSEDLSLMYVNKAIMTLFGYAPDDMLSNKKVTDFLSPKQPDGRKLEDIYKEVSSSPTIIVQVQCVKKDGTEFLARIASCKITFKGKPASLATIEDITAQEEYTQKLENIAVQEYEANQLKSRFLATMSHEVRTPMNAIIGITEILLQNESLSIETEEALNKIYDSGSLLLNIINDILDLSKIEAGKLEIHPVRYDIPSLVNDTVQLTRLRYESTPVDFILNVDANTPINVFGDELRIRQILNNILSNAFKYTRKGRVTLSIASEIIPGFEDRVFGNSPDTDENPENDVILIFTISDTGQGISEEQLENLFSEYTRFNMEANRTTVGTGLGMSITKRLVDLMNGKISAVSQVGKGTVFIVRIPQRRIDNIVCGEQMSEKLQEYRFQSMRIAKKSGILREYMPYGSVLIVDDVETNIYVTNGMLMPYGLKIDSATSGFEVIDKIKEGRRYDIIFMDHMMPVMDGIQTVQILRDMGYKDNIVALTANALVGQAEIFLQNGFDGYISKPIDSRELNNVLNEMIRNKKPASVIKKARREQASMLSNTLMRQSEAPGKKQKNSRLSDTAKKIRNPPK